MTEHGAGRPELTARGVKMMLTRAGVDYSALTITDDPAVWTNVETGVGHTSVVIAGPKEARSRAAGVLYGKGLGNAPYPEYDMWSRA
jgi:hypothetical protein